MFKNEYNLLCQSLLITQWNWTFRKAIVHFLFAVVHRICQQSLGGYLTIQKHCVKTEWSQDCVNDAILYVSVRVPASETLPTAVINWLMKIDDFLFVCLSSIASRISNWTTDILTHSIHVPGSEQNNPAPSLSAGEICVMSQIVLVGPLHKMYTFSNECENSHLVTNLHQLHDSTPTDI